MLQCWATCRQQFHMRPVPAADAGLALPGRGWIVPKGRVTEPAQPLSSLSQGAHPPLRPSPLPIHHANETRSSPEFLQEAISLLKQVFET